MGRPRKYIYHNKDYTFRVKQGDIFKETADVMVVPAFTKVDPKFGLEKIVYEKAGKEALIKERKRYQNGGELKICGLLETSAQNLKNVKCLFHVVPPANRTQDIDLLEKCYEVCIDHAVNKKYDSVIFPLIGSKNMMFSVFDAYKAAKNSIERKLIENKTGTLTVTLVVSPGAVCYIDALENGRDIYCTPEITQEPFEYAVRMQDMLKTIESKDLSRELYTKMQKDRKAYEKRDINVVKNLFAANVMREILDSRLTEISNKTGTSRSKCINELAKKSDVSESTIKSIISDKRTKQVIHKHDRNTKIRLAVALKLNTQERIRFIIADDNEPPYPCGEFENH